MISVSDKSRYGDGNPKRMQYFEMQKNLKADKQIRVLDYSGANILLTWGCQIAKLDVTKSLAYITINIKSDSMF